MRILKYYCRTVIVVAPASSVDDVVLPFDSRDHVCHVPTGLEALRLARAAVDGLWLIDVGLPDMSGFDLVEMLRAVQPHAAVLLVADQYREADELRALSLGVAGYTDWASLGSCERETYVRDARCA